MTTNFFLLVSFSSFLSSTQCPLFCTSSSVIFAACSVGDSYAQRHHHHTLILSHSLLCAFISVVLFPLSLFSLLFLMLIFPLLSVSSLQSFCHCPSISADISSFMSHCAHLQRIAGDSMCKFACLTFLLCPIYVTQPAESAVSVLDRQLINLHLCPHVRFSILNFSKLFCFSFNQRHIYYVALPAFVFS